MNDTRKPVRRRTVQQHRRRRIVVTVGPGDVIGFRQERTRKTYTYPIDALFDHVVARTIMAERAARRGRR